LKQKYAILKSNALKYKLKEIPNDFIKRCKAFSRMDCFHFTIRSTAVKKMIEYLHEQQTLEPEAGGSSDSCSSTFQGPSVTSLIAGFTQREYKTLAGKAVCGE